jgi:hypothetical protein
MFAGCRLWGLGCWQTVAKDPMAEPWTLKIDVDHTKGAWPKTFTISDCTSKEQKQKVLQEVSEGAKRALYKGAEGHPLHAKVIDIQLELLGFIHSFPNT